MQLLVADIRKRDFRTKSVADPPRYLGGYDHFHFHLEPAQENWHNRFSS